MVWILALLLVFSTAQADVIRKQNTKSQIFGSSEGTSTDYYTADKHATESTLRWTSGVMKTMTGGKDTQSGEIVRLDKELIWSIDPKKETYTEMTFAEFRELMKKGFAEMEEAQGEAEEAPDTTSEEMYTWTVEDKSDPNPKTIRNWTCRNMNMVATGVNRHDEQDKVIITMDIWNCPDVAGAQEIKDFQVRYMKALGMDELVLTPGLAQAALLYQKQFQELIEAAKRAPGEPVQSLMEIKRNQLKGPNIGKAVAEGAKQELMGKLPFGKKKEPKQEKPEYVLKTKYLYSMELIEASTGTVDAAKFEIPAEYKLKKK